MCCAEMHPFQTHSSPLEAAEAGTQTVGHSPQSCRPFRVSPPMPLSVLPNELPEPALTVNPTMARRLAGVTRRSIGETHRRSQQKSHSDRTRNSTSGAGLAASVEAPERPVLPGRLIVCFKISRANICPLSPSAAGSRAAAPSRPGFGLLGTQRSGARKKSRQN
jgi:hypothetical protein